MLRLSRLRSASSRTMCLTRHHSSTLRRLNSMMAVLRASSTLLTLLVRSSRVFRTVSCLRMVNATRTTKLLSTVRTPMPGQLARPTWLTRLHSTVKTNLSPVSKSRLVLLRTNKLRMSTRSQECTARMLLPSTAMTSLKWNLRALSFSRTPQLSWAPMHQTVANVPSSLTRTPRVPTTTATLREQATSMSSASNNT